MTLILCRVDDRLIHGQVVLGWGRPLKADRTILVDDEVAANDWEQNLYRMALTEDMPVEFHTSEQAISLLDSWAASPERIILLTGQLSTMADLYHARPSLISAINLGGIHYRSDRRELLSYLYLSEAEESLLAQLISAGASISAQDLPTTLPVSGKVLLR